MRKNSVIATGLILTVCVLAAVPLVFAAPTPFLIGGYVFYANGSECSAPHVTITNYDNGNDWQAKNYSSSNYYQLVLANGTDLNVSETIRFDVSSGTQSKTLARIITETEVHTGGLFDTNVTLGVPPATPFIIRGWVVYDNGNPCETTNVSITNINVGETWTAETYTGHNFYQLVIGSTNVSSGDRLEINATDGAVFNATEHLVTSEHLQTGGFEQNVTLTIPSAVPVVESIEISPDDYTVEVGIQIDPVPEANKTVNITAVVSDANGWEDVDTVIARISGPTSVDDSPVYLAFVSNNSATNATYRGSFNMSFYYAPGNYTVNVTATDNDGLNGCGTENYTYKSCIGLSIDAASVVFGDIDPGENSSIPGNEDYDLGSTNGMTIKNTGNVELDLNPIEASDMAGTSGTIPNANLYCGFTDGDYSMNLDSPTSYDLNLCADEASYNRVNLRLHVPTGTAVGSYSGNITMTAVSS